MELDIEKLVYGGEGLARIEQPNGRRKTVFVPLVLPGERVEASIVEERPGFARAKLKRVLQASPQRTSPPCPYFGECGGCHYQHATYDEQLKEKREILRETVARIAKIELPDIETYASPPLHYRNRTRLKAAAMGGNETKFVIGYHKLGSQELLPVGECPISSPLINRAIQAIWDMAVESDLPRGLGEFEFFADDTDGRLLVELLASDNADQASMMTFAEAFQKKLPELAGVVAVPHLRHADELVAAPELEVSVSDAGTALIGERYLDYRVGGFSYRVSAGSFFQTNRHLTSELLRLASAEARGKLAIDLYAGVGLFTAGIAQNFERVIAVESASPSYTALKANVPRNAKPVQSTTERFLARTQPKAEFVIVDPPRAGLGKRVVAGLAKLAPKSLAYVSCDPSTLARDLPGLITAGYRITQAHLVDLFPQTFHMETVLRMER